jgi:hypothetical protein
MFAPGDIVYFSPFYFKNGNHAKNKYFVVLKNINDKILLAILPTRRDSIPQCLSVECGCIEAPHINFNCFVFAPHTQVTECGKSFDFPTHLYGSQIDDYDINYMKDIYRSEGKDYILWGKMKSDLYDKLIDCFSSSRAIKRKYKKILRQSSDS